MLKNLLNGKEASNFILLKDFEDCNGRILTKAFTRNSVNRGCHVTVVTYDTSPKDVEEYAVNRENLTILNGYTDPLAWDDVRDTSLVDYDLEKFSSKLQGLVVIDSLTPVLLNSPIHRVYRTLHTLVKCQTVEQVFATVHTDVHEETDVRYLEHLSQTVITMERRDATCNILHKRHSGKILQAKEVFLVNHDLELSSQPMKEEELIASLQSTVVPKKPPDVTSDWTTFSLSLKDDEKAAREKLVLPYTSQKTNLQSGGKIFYNLDEADDFDEEDPDEDLNV